MTETSTDGKTGERFTQRRSIGFPVVALPEAVQVLKKAGQHGNEHSVSAFATYLGHSTANSGSFKRRLAAFRDWQFVTGRGDRVVLTELGHRIAYPTNADKELHNLQEAFRNCEVFYKVWDEAAKGEPYGLTVLANLGIRYGVSARSKDRFAESLSESAVAAGFAKPLDNGKIAFVRPDQGGDGAGAGSGQGDENRGGSGDQPPGDAPPPPPPRSIPALVQQVWSITGGKVVLEIHSDRPLPAHAYAKLASVVSEAKSLADVLTVENEGTVADDDLEG
jgi:hypothetical protein